MISAPSNIIARATIHAISSHGGCGPYPLAGSLITRSSSGLDPGGCGVTPASGCCVTTISGCGLDRSVGTLPEGSVTSGGGGGGGGSVSIGGGSVGGGHDPPGQAGPSSDRTMAISSRAFIAAPAFQR